MDIVSATAQVAALKATPNRQDGNTVPETGKAAPPPPQAEEVQAAVAQIQRFLSQSSLQLEFVVDEGSGRTIIRVSDPETGQTIRQIPPEEILKLASLARSSGSAIFSATA
jgi:flagellar protein FlaG